MVTEIPLTQGHIALVDDADVALVSQYRWQYQGRRSGAGYARTTFGKGSKPSGIFMHRLIMAPPPELQVDHRDGDGLNNRRSNLRLATNSQNEENRHKTQPSSKTGVRGVHLDKRTQRYIAYISRNSNTIRIGSYLTIEEATAAVTAARKRFYTHSSECDETANTPRVFPHIADRKKAGRTFYGPHRRVKSRMVRRYVTGAFVGWKWHDHYGQLLLMARFENIATDTLILASDLDESTRAAFEAQVAIPAAPDQRGLEFGA